VLAVVRDCAAKLPAYATYPVATFAGLFANAVFGAFIAYTYIALWRQRPHIVATTGRTR
jgi:hypothetical protein